MENTTENAIRAMPEAVPESSGLIMKSGNKTFIIGLHFSDKLIRKDVEDGNF